MNTLWLVAGLVVAVAVGAIARSMLVSRRRVGEDQPPPHPQSNERTKADPQARKPTDLPMHWRKGGGCGGGNGDVPAPD